MIYHHAEDVSFSPKGKLSLRKWISDAISNEGKIVGDINYIYCSDEYLLELNRSSLNHDYYTDIITFDYVEEEVISGDLFISIDRVKENANENNVTFEIELSRVMIHGVMHLCGYGDKTEKEEKTMRCKEDFYLQRQKTNTNN
jgi:rRNA maturation RNase YbeY